MTDRSPGPVRGIALPSFLSAEDGDIAEHACRRRVADADPLVGLALAAGRRAEHCERRAVTDHLQASPERRRYSAVVRIAHDAVEPSVFDQLSPLATEL